MDLFPFWVALFLIMVLIFYWMKHTSSLPKSNQIKVGYWTLDNIKFSDKLDTGKFTLLDKNMSLLSEKGTIEISYSDLKEHELRKMHGVGTYVHLKSDNNTINFFVPRVNIANWFIVNNYFKTQNVFDAIEKKVNSGLY